MQNTTPDHPREARECKRKVKNKGILLTSSSGHLLIQCEHRVNVRLGNPPYLKNMLKPYEPLRSLLSSTMDLLTVPRTDTSFGLWNGLPHELIAMTVQHTSVFQVSLEDILLPLLHGQLAPHSQVVPPISFFMTKLARAK